MGLKILHTADWHLDSPFGAFQETQRSTLRRELRKVPGRLVELAHKEQVDLVLLAGDIFDGVASRESIDLMRHTLREFEVPVFISPGNHDFCSPDSPWLAENWPENVHVFTGGLESVAIPELSCRIYGAGYQSMDCPPLLQGFSAQGQERYCIGLLHGDPMVRQSPCCAITAAQVRESGLDYLALGHIHKAGSFQSGSTICAWPGCPMGRGWDETGEKGACIVTLDDTVQVRAVPLDFLRFYDLEVEIGEEACSALEQVLPATAGEDFYRITLTGSGSPDLAALQAYFSRFPNLELRDRTEPPVPLWSQLEEDSLKGVFFRLLKNSEDPNASLAAEISQRLLLGKEVRLP
jgi:DNA repair exonuclease SbcCD nuclease subunit